MADYVRPTRLMPELARSPLVKTNYNAPMFIGQVYRKSFGYSKSLAIITDIDNSNDNRHDATIQKYPHSIGPNALIRYLIITIIEPHKNNKDKTITIGAKNTALHSDKFTKFNETFPYLCFCPHTFPFFVTHTNIRSTLTDVNEAFDPTSERVKQIERSRWRHSQTK